MPTGIEDVEQSGAVLVELIDTRYALERGLVLEQQLRERFQEYGPIRDLRVFQAQQCAAVQYDSIAHALQVRCGFRVQGSVFRAQVTRYAAGVPMVQGSGNAARCRGLGIGAQGSEFTVQGSGLRSRDALQVRSGLGLGAQFTRLAVAVGGIGHCAAACGRSGFRPPMKLRDIQVLMLRS